MRRAGIPLTALLFAAPAALAQVPPVGVPTAGERVPVPGATPVAGQPGGLVAAPEVPAALMNHLQEWEKVMRGTTNFHTECTLVRKHMITKKESQYAGRIICLKPNLAWMRVDEKPGPGKKQDPNAYTAYICNGKAVYEYDGGVKQVTEFLLPNGGVGDNLLLTFMSGGMKATDIIQRFDIKLQSEDQNYVVLEIRPREARDKAEFESLQLALFGPKVPNFPQLAYLPRTVVMRKNNGQEIEQWDFSQPQVNVGNVKPADFQFIPPPADWKVQRAQAPAGQTRVARPQGQ